MESVQNLHKVFAVVRGGDYYSKDALDSLKQKVRKHLESAQAASIPAEKATP
jgi:hypothetical protein